ncbi:MAG: anti-sigma factor [Gemmatimonadaceae bacterium]|nr:anti-sigma factor [Gemmatimonadaceae bacterium]
MMDDNEPPLSDAQQWEVAAAELTAAMAFDARTASDALPPALAERITKAGEAFVRTTRVPGVTANPVVPITSAVPARRLASWTGWLAAAAVLAVWVGVSRWTGSSASAPVVSVAQTGVVLRDSLLQADSALTRLAWGASTDSSAIGATGDVVWSARAQRGVMRIAGLQPNDRTRWQYQLWIFDKKRDQRYPVDGGVFDIPAGAHEVFVPIDARLPVGEAVLFAITIEPPGGVVVSKRERIALLAKPAS